MIKHHASSVNTPAIEILTLPQLAVLLYALRERELPRFWIANKLGMSLRSVAYHLAALKRQGLLIAEHRFVPNTGGYRRLNGQAYFRSQTCNRYKPGASFAPLSPSALLRRLRKQTLLQLRSKDALRDRGAKLRAHLMTQALILLEELAQRWGVSAERLLVETHRYLRRWGKGLRSDIMLLMGLRGYLNRRFSRHRIRDPMGLMCYALAPAPEDAAIPNMWWE